MAEFKFVIKCFLFACALVALTQLKSNGLTMEAHIQNSLLNTSVAHFVNQTAEGGLILFEKALDYSKEKVSGINFSSNEPKKQVIRYPAAKKTVDNSDLKSRNGEISHDADFNYDSDLE